VTLVALTPLAFGESPSPNGRGFECSGPFFFRRAFDLPEGRSTMAERKTVPQGGGLNERALEPATEEPLGGTGGSAGGGTIAGSGEPEGANTDTELAADEAVLASPGELAGTADRAIAAEMAALGPAEEEPAEGGPTLGEAIGSGAGGDVGSGTKGDRAGLGGGLSGPRR
jgi:hypothetical protein